MGIIDISVPLHKDMPLWPGSEGFRLKRTMNLENGDEANVNTLTCDIHTGTHVESPIHCVIDGKSIDRISLDIFCGPAFVADLTHIDTIKEENLTALKIPDGIKRILFKTRNSKLWDSDKNNEFNQDYVALSRDAAKWLVTQNIYLVGIDYLSIQHYNDGSEVHKILLKGGVMLLEGIDLSNIQPGKYELICLPLKIIGAEGSPVRAVLRPFSGATPDEK